MRIKKLSLLAAAGLVCSGLHASTVVDITATSSPVTNISGSADYFLTAGSTLMVDSTLDTTYSGRIVGYGDVVKMGNGTLELAGFANDLRTGYYNNQTFITSQATLTDAATIKMANRNPQDLYTLGATTGNLRIAGGTVVVSGYINQYVGYDWQHMAQLLSWAGHGTSDVVQAAANNNRNALFGGRFTTTANLIDPAGSPETAIVGFNSTILEGNATLSFRNAPLSTPNANPVLGDRKPDTTPVPGDMSLQFVRNLKAGVENNQTSTSLEVGIADTSRLVVYTTPGETGSIGKITGTGGLFFNGSGEFKILNDSSFTGNVVVVGGTLSLEGPGGGSLADAESVNFGGSFDNRGNNVAGVDRNGNYAEYKNQNGEVISAEWQPIYSPESIASDKGLIATLRVSGDQSIRNFQSNFIFNSFWMEMEDRFVTEPYLADMGEDGELRFANATDTLTINQTRDGLFYGNIIGENGGGRLILTGGAKLALQGTVSTLNYLEVQSGELVANTDMLGSGRVVVRDGSKLTLRQRDTGTLRAQIEADTQGVLTFTNHYSINMTFGDVGALEVTGPVGTVHIITPQSGFHGSVMILDGITVMLDAPGGDVFSNAASVTLNGGDSNYESRLLINDSNQTLRNFSGDAYSRLDLGHGNLTLQQETDLVFSGKLTGSGNLIKQGSKTLMLAGRDAQDASVDTLYGTTVVRQGTLSLGGSNQLPNTAGLVLTGGSLSVMGDQTFGALFGSHDAVLDMGAGTLTIGLSSDRIAALQAAAPSYYAGYYLATNGSSVLANYDATKTRAFLGSDAVGLSGPALEKLSYDGTLVGTGALVKRGKETLTLSNTSDGFTGAVRVEDGTLRLNFDSLRRVSGVEVNTPGIFALNADATTGSGVFDRSITGSGLIRKDGDAALTLGQNVLTNFAGDILVAEGRLTLTATDSIKGPVATSAIGVIEFNQASNVAVTLSGAVSNLGSLVKTGQGALALDDYSGDGSVVVREGALALGHLPAGQITVNNGAVFSATVTDTRTLSLPVLAEVTSPAGLGGTVVLRGSGSSPTLLAAADNLFEVTPLQLENITFRLADSGPGSIQTVAGVTTDAASVVDLNGGTLILSVNAPLAATFAGTVTGAGSINMNGTGTQTFTGDSSWVGTLTINSGTVVANDGFLGSNTVDVKSSGTLALINDDALNAVTLGANITGAGTLLKQGMGEVKVASVGVSGNVAVTAGRLTVLSASDASVFGAVTVSPGAVFQVNLAADITHDSAVPGTNSLTSESLGSLAVSGAGQTLTLAGSQSYKGSTELLNGAKLAFADAAARTLNGLSSDTSATQVIMSGALALRQGTDGTFYGDFKGAASDLIVSAGATGSSGKFIYAGHAGNLAAVENDGLASVSVAVGGKLQVSSANTKTIALAGGSLYLDTSSAAGSYAGAITGAGSVFKTGAGELTLSDTSLFSYSGNLGVDQGALKVAVDGIGSNITGLRTEGPGTLRLDVASGDASLAIPVSGTGNLEKTGQGRLLLGTAANPYTVSSSGAFTVSAGTLGGNFTTSGDLIVAPGSTLAPGNSPGTVTVNGAYSQNGNLAIELTRTTSDKVVVSGSATLGGTLTVSQYGAAAPVRGTRYAILSAASVSGDFTAVQNDLAGFTGIWVEKTVSGVNLVPVQSLSATTGYTPHEGLAELLAQLDARTTPSTTTGAISDSLGLALVQTPTAALDSAVNGLSPLGYASEYAMAQDGEARRQSLLHDRLEQRRYDRASTLSTEDAPYEMFVVGGGVFADNDDAKDTATFDYRTFGGLAGLDSKVSDDLLVGAAIGYDTGKADLKNSGGKVDMNRMAATAFLSTQLTKRWYLDVGATAGIGLYESDRNTVVGKVTGDNTGFSGGLTAETGTIVMLSKDVHLTPYLAAAYTHHEFGAIDETGSAAALKVDSWSQDSLRAKVGTGLGWFVPTDWAKLKLGLDVAYSHELLDTDSELDSRFVSAAGSKFSTTAAALPQDAISLSPSLGIEFDETTSATLSYTYEMGFDSRSYQSVNFAIRRRF